MRGSGSGFRAENSRCWIQTLRFRVQGLGIRVWGSGFRGFKKESLGNSGRKAGEARKRIVAGSGTWKLAEESGTIVQAKSSCHHPPSSSLHPPSSVGSGWRAWAGPELIRLPRHGSLSRTRCCTLSTPMALPGYSSVGDRALGRESFLIVAIDQRLFY